VCIRRTPFPSAARLRPPPWGWRADFRQSSGARTDASPVCPEVTLAPGRARRRTSPGPHRRHDDRRPFSREAGPTRRGPPPLRLPAVPTNGPGGAPPGDPSEGRAIARARRAGSPDTHPFVTVPQIHSFAAHKFGAKHRPRVISNTQKASALRSAKGGCLTSLYGSGFLCVSCVDR
jgi:hypothetical protein